MEQISFQYPSWLIGLCMLLALGFGLVVYYKTKQFNDRHPNLKLLLAALRFLTVFLILLLLLNPILKLTTESVKKPILVIAQDVSQSMNAEVRIKEPAFIENRNKLEEKLTDKYDVVHLEIGADVTKVKRDSFSENVTNLSSVFDYCKNEFDLLQLNHIVLISDGIFNQGKSPMYNDLLESVPVSCILFGDTTPVKDVFIQSLNYNELVHAGDQFGLQVDFMAWNCNNAIVPVILKEFRNGNWIELDRHVENVNSERYFSVRDFLIQTTKPGIYKYRVELVKVPGEDNPVNNIKEFYVEVIDSKKKILIIAHAPHPDISAIKSILNSSLNYTVDLKFVKDPIKELNTYDAAIFHQIGSLTAQTQSLINTLNSNKIPMLYVIGSQSKVFEFNRFQSGIKILQHNGSFNDAVAVPNPNFTPFTLTEELIRQLPKYPPLNAPFGTYTLAPSTYVLLHQKIGKVETEYPLWAVSDHAGLRSAYILGDGLWKWRLSEYTISSATDLVSEILLNTIQYITTVDDKRKFRVQLNKKIFNEGESIPFMAEFYNDNLERINTPDAFLKVINADQGENDYSFSKTDNYYTIDLPGLGPGEYNYTAKLNWNQKDHTVNGKFSIIENNAEKSNRIADHNLLKNIAGLSSGKTYMPSNTDLLYEDLINSPKAKPVVYFNTDFRPLLNLKWIFALLFVLLSSEWFLRRYFGSY